MALGGKRKGAGNKEGSTRPNFFKFVTPDDVTKYMDWVLKNYKKNPKLAMWLGDHIFGKAVQPVAGDDGKGNIVPILAQLFDKK